MRYRPLTRRRLAGIRVGRRWPRTATTGQCVHAIGSQIRPPLLTHPSTTTTASLAAAESTMTPPAPRTNTSAAWTNTPATSGARREFGVIGALSATDHAEGP